MSLIVLRPKWALRTNLTYFMSPEEQLLLNWRNSLPPESILSNDFSINKQTSTVLLTTTRCLNENDLGASLVKKCSYSIDSIQKSIDLLSEKREILLTI